MKNKRFLRFIQLGCQQFLVAASSSACPFSVPFSVFIAGLFSLNHVPHGISLPFDVFTGMTAGNGL
ncbi:hypothetical protein [Oxalobacter paraformigenes]|uniref:hypothetical protein n=1 Tax=Oxalobacter paraformigenes TaxID=556268 RepID=UPI00030E4853|nr:hypothetical protein [Oxalobacter paraformigenes]